MAERKQSTDMTSIDEFLTTLTPEEMEQEPIKSLIAECQQREADINKRRAGHEATQADYAKAQRDLYGALQGLLNSSEAVARQAVDAQSEAEKASSQLGDNSLKIKTLNFELECQRRERYNS